MANLFSKLKQLIGGEKKSPPPPDANDAEAPKEHAAVFSTTRATIDEALLTALAPGAIIENSARDGVRTFTCRWDDLAVTYFVDPQWDREVQTNGMKGLINHLAGGPPYGPVLRALWSKIETTVTCYGGVITPRFDQEGRARKVVLGLAEYFQGYVFSHQSFYASTGERIIGDPDDPDPLGPNLPMALRDTLIWIQEQKARVPSPEAAARKERSLAQLRAEGVPTLEHLPIVEDESQAITRSTREVAERAIAICLTAVKGEGMEPAEVLKLVGRYGAQDFFSEEELEFIQNPDSEDLERCQFSWRYECLWVLLWALGYIDKLDSPRQICDVPRAVGLLRERNTEQFIEQANLRPISEILNEADLIYRYHWAVVDARVKKLPAPAGLEPGVVKERHYVLNWLVGHAGQAWDDVLTDT